MSQFLFLQYIDIPEVCKRKLRRKKIRDRSYKECDKYPFPVAKQMNHQYKMYSVGNIVNNWTAVHKAPLPMAFSRQEYWSR